MNVTVGRNGIRSFIRPGLAVASAFALIAVACALGGCQGQAQTQTQQNASASAQQETSSSTQQKSDELYQVALLQSLTLGDYDGIVTMADLKQRGDTGIGTFEAVNGEMVVLDGTVYQCLGDGSVRVASDDTTTPFANVTFLDGDISRDISATSVDDLKSQLTAIVQENGANQFYMVRLDATFDSVGVRSELAQQKPYETFDKVLARDQREFSYGDVKGTIVALYCPAYAKSVNTPGWHFHFISDDRTKGGHVLSLSGLTGTAKIDKIGEIDIKLPDDGTFNGLDLGEDQSSRITSVEQKSN